jgi:hypothetical protein
MHLCQHVNTLMFIIMLYRVTTLKKRARVESNQVLSYTMFVMFGRKVGRQFHGCMYNRINSTTSPASGVGNISEPRVISQIRVRVD